MAKHYRHRKLILIVLGIVGIIVAGAIGYLIYSHYNKTPKIITVNNVKHQSQASNNSSRGKITPTSGFSSTSKNGSTKNSSTGSSTTTISGPLGPFVSNHNVNLSNQAELTEESVCNTVAGASCYISFTNKDNGVAYDLPTQTANSSGAVYWNWNIQTANLSSGTWQIEAITSLDGQTRTTTDSQNLTISSS